MGAVSVFECSLEAAELEQVMGELGWEIDEREDSVRVYRLCGACTGEMRILGQGEKWREHGYYIV